MSSLIFGQVAALEYHDTSVTALFGAEDLEVVSEELGSPEEQQVVTYSEEEVAAHVDAARLEAVRSTEERLRQEFAVQLAARDTALGEAVRRFEDECGLYFARVEREVVQLALSIARKIIRRESQADPMLLLALVRVALDQMQEGPPVSLRVAPAELVRWQQMIAAAELRSVCQVVADVELKEGDCYLDTHMGSANFSIEAQLKEVEQGFFDLLAQRPGAR